MTKAAWSRQPSSLVHAPVDPTELQLPEIPRGAIPLTAKGDNFNMNTMLVQNILESAYTKQLIPKDFQELLGEIYNHTEHVEPYSVGTSRTPSTPWCVLYKMLCMRLTRNQMRMMLNHQDSVYIRAVGFLYLRLATDPKELWDWYEPYLDDDMEITPAANPASKTTLGKYVQSLLTEQKYYGVMLPRIPVMTARDLNTRILLREEAAQRAIVNAQYSHKFKKGTKVEAMFSEDNQWYAATLGDEVYEGVFHVVYDNYGNSEERPLGYIRLTEVEEAAAAKGRSTSRGRSSYNDVAKRVLERERSKALATGKDYAQRPASYKGSLSLKMDRYTTRDRSRSPVRRHRSSDRSPPRRDRSRDRDGRGGGSRDRDGDRHRRRSDHSRERSRDRHSRRSRDRHGSSSSRRDRSRDRDRHGSSRRRHGRSRSGSRDGSRRRHRSRSGSRGKRSGGGGGGDVGRGGGSSSGASARHKALLEKYGDASAGSRR